MQYITEKKKELSYLINVLNSEASTLLLNDGIYYTKKEISAKTAKIQREIDGYKRVHANMQNLSWTIEEFALFKALARKEFDYFLEVENKIDSFTTTKVLASMTSEGYEKTFILVKNLSAKIANRSRADFRDEWITNRTFELACSGEIEDLTIDSDSIAPINCLESVMCGKISKKELVASNMWREVHKDKSNDIYVEVGDLLRHNKHKLVIPR